MAVKQLAVGDLEPSLAIKILLDGDVTMTGATIQIFTGSYSNYNSATTAFHADLTYQTSTTTDGKTCLDGVHELRTQDTALNAVGAHIINARILYPGAKPETIKGAASVEVIVC